MEKHFIFLFSVLIYKEYTLSYYCVIRSAGFIGSRVPSKLLAQGHTVIGIDNLCDAYDVRLKEWRLKQSNGHSRFEFHNVDICDYGALADLWQRTPTFDAVINLAARAGVRPSVTDPWIYFQTNVLGTVNLLDLCRKHQVVKFVLASSSSVYGNGNVPYQEAADTNHPISPYAASKKAAEELCYTYHYLHGLDITVFRYFTVYGPAGRPDMSPFRFVQWISEGYPVTVFGDGTQARDFTFVEDIANGTILGLRPLGFQVVNLRSDKPVVLMDIIKLIEELVDRPANLEFKPRHPADVNKTWADISKANELLEWEPKTHYTQGFKAVVDWYQENREWASAIVT